MSDKEYAARYRAKHPEKVRQWNKDYYRRHREEMRRKAAKYRRIRKDGLAGASAEEIRHPLPLEWNIAFERKNGVWSWTAQKDGRRLNGGPFATLRAARRDCSDAVA